MNVSKVFKNVIPSPKAFGMGILNRLKHSVWDSFRRGPLEKQAQDDEKQTLLTNTN